MATTYTTAFELSVSALALTSVTKFNDNLRSDSSTHLNLARHVALALSSESTDPAATANLPYGLIVDVPAAGSVNLDLRSITDLAGRVGQAFNAYRFCFLMLLPPEKGGTTCSGVTIGGATTAPHRLFLGADADNCPLENGDWLMNAKGPASPRVVDDAHRNVLITNNDPLVAAKVLVVLVGVS